MPTGCPDPRRRERIITATLSSIAQVGVAGTSHRHVAARAGVPLGSMTYHFGGLADLLHEAFNRFADDGAAALEARLAGVHGQTEAIEALADHLMADLEAERGRVITMELYTLATRDAAFRDITTAWTRRTRAALAPWFGPAAAREVDALLEGLFIHRALGDTPADRDAVLAAMARLADSDRLEGGQA